MITSVHNLTQKRTSSIDYVVWCPFFQLYSETFHYLSVTGELSERVMSRAGFNVSDSQRTVEGMMAEVYGFTRQWMEGQVCERRVVPVLVLVCKQHRIYTYSTASFGCEIELCCNRKCYCMPARLTKPSHCTSREVVQIHTV